MAKGFIELMVEDWHRFLESVEGLTLVPTDDPDVDHNLLKDK